jgi:nitrogen fixation NifU-like protein
MDIKSMYQQIILDHNNHPLNYGTISPFTHQQLGHNPLCGDKIIIFANIDPSTQTLTDISFQGESCAICKASASLLTETVKGKTIKQVEDILALFKKMILTSEILESSQKQLLNKLILFEGVKQYPARVKCALLSCRTLESILNNSTEPISTE